MAGGGVAGAVGANTAQYNGRLTGHVIAVAVMAACGGLLFGYDIVRWRGGGVARGVGGVGGTSPGLTPPCIRWNVWGGLRAPSAAGS